MSQKHKKGFTLIELLVVISIISLLSSIVMTTLSGAKTKAKDALIKQEIYELTKLAELEYSDNESYCNLQVNWVPVGNTTCSSAFVAGNYASQAKTICDSIVKNATRENGNGVQYKMLSDTEDHKCLNSYSFSAYLNNGNWYCAGSSGSSGEYSSNDFGAGCWRNP
jgi:prepilin-type N-terminal cleavage/methylation domain-containing protein